MKALLALLLVIVPSFGQEEAQNRCPQSLQLVNCSCMRLHPTTNNISSTTPLAVTCDEARLRPNSTIALTLPALGGTGTDASEGVPILPEGLFDNLHLVSLSLTNSGVYYVKHSALAEEQARTIVDLSLAGNAFRDVPFAILTHMAAALENLNLSNNQIIYVPKGPFDRLDKLKWLDLSRNRIMFVDDYSLAGLKSLTTLNLQDNNLEQIGPLMLDGLTSLRVLILKNNPMRVALSRQLFGTHLRQLKYLDLSSCQLRHILPRAFDSLVSLEELDLSGNQLADLERESFYGLGQLHALHLADNRGVRLLPQELLHSLPALRILDASNCSLETLVPGTFDSTPAVRVVDLRNNSLAFLPRELFKPIEASLSELYLGGNKFVCDFRLGWLRQWLMESAAGRNSVADIADIRCFEPPNLRDTPIAT